MDPKFQTSFIPKKPIVIGGLSATLPKDDSVGLFYIVSVILFIVTLFSMAGLYGYKIIVSKQLQQAETELNAAREAFDPNAVQDLISTSRRISFADQLLSKHVATSRILDLLGSLTIKKFKFNTLSYKNDEGGSKVTAEVESLSYSMFGQQALLFQANSNLKDPVFSDFDITDKGTIKARFSSLIDPNLISYKKSLEGFVNQLNQ